MEKITESGIRYEHYIRIGISELPIVAPICKELLNELTAINGGLTSWFAYGYWQNSHGVLEKEPSLCIDISSEHNEVARLRPIIAPYMEHLCPNGENWVHVSVVESIAFHFKAEAFTAEETS